MGRAIKFSIVLLVILGLSVVLTPSIHWLLSPFFRFEKIFNRLVMIFGVTAAVLYVLLQKKRRGGTFLDRETWREYGFDFSKPWRSLFLYGFAAGALSVFILAFLEASFGPRYFRQPVLMADVIQRFLKGLLSGMTVGIVEEFFLRGFIYTHLRRNMNLWLAVFLASVFYSLCHFFDNGMIFIPAHPTMKDAFRLLLGYLEPITHRPLQILPEFFGLFLFGVVLNIAFVRTRSLFLPIGIHAGAVFLVKWQYSFVRPGPELYHSFFGNLPYYDGFVEWVLLLLLASMILPVRDSARTLH